MAASGVEEAFRAMTHEPDDRRNGGADSSDGDLSGRLARLDSELARRNASKTNEGGSRFGGSNSSGLAQAFRLSSEFVAGVIAGGLVGWIVDYLFGSSPWGLIVFLLLGFVAGVMNVMRSAGLTKGPGA